MKWHGEGDDIQIYQEKTSFYQLLFSVCDTHFSYVDVAPAISSIYKYRLVYPL